MIRLHILYWWFNKSAQQQAAMIAGFYTVCLILVLGS